MGAKIKDLYQFCKNHGKIIKNSPKNHQNRDHLPGTGNNWHIGSLNQTINKLLVVDCSVWLWRCASLLDWGWLSNNKNNGKQIVYPLAGNKTHNLFANFVKILDICKSSGALSWHKNRPRGTYSSLILLASPSPCHTKINPENKISQQKPWQENRPRST